VNRPLIKDFTFNSGKNQKYTKNKNPFHTKLNDSSKLHTHRAFPLANAQPKMPNKYAIARAQTERKEESTLGNMLSYAMRGIQRN